MAFDDDLSRFIVSSIPSVWTLEILLLLRREQRPLSRDELIGALRASELVVAQALDSLVAGGLAGVSEEGAVYMPISDPVAACVDKLAQTYASRPDQVRRLIVMSSASGIAAFADAFRLRKD